MAVLRDKRAILTFLLLIQFTFFVFAIKSDQSQSLQDTLPSQVNNQQDVKSTSIVIKDNNMNSSTPNNISDNPKIESKLIWMEDFSLYNLSSPNSKFWNIADKNLPIYNQEVQKYSSSNSNVRVENGALILQAQKTNAGITSGRVDTKGKVKLSSGTRLEANIKLPMGKGVWPAFWLLSDNQPYTALKNPTDLMWQQERFYMWDGEIDIMEYYGNIDNSIEATVHTFDQTKENQYPLVNDNKFHTYWFEWQKDKLVFGVDDKAYHQYVNPGSGPSAWPFTEDNQMYLILNLAMGGTGGGQIVESITDNWKMEIAYVKLSKL